MSKRLIYLIRHGETEWSLNGRHTGSTDIPLTENGRAVATRLASALDGIQFDLVLTSPLQRARETCALAGLEAQAEVDADLVEWNYGQYEGLTPNQIRAGNPDWLVFRDGCPGGESSEHIGARADWVISRVQLCKGNVALFSHGHFLRVFAARWIGLPASGGCHFLLDTATLCVLSEYHGNPAILHWNAPVAN
ncbi:MAG TPA: histidine phosphatase family protein [Dongiaceae bacterium]|nr:histidine phosphatase family protein [Dongiaceae bacterium]